MPMGKIKKPKSSNFSDMSITNKRNKSQMVKGVSKMRIKYKAMR